MQKQVYSGIFPKYPHLFETPAEKRHYQPDAMGQLNLFREIEIDEPPDPDDYPTIEAFEQAWQAWEQSGGQL